MYDQIEKVENISNNFDNMGPGFSFMKEKISTFNFPSKFNINFEGCHVAINKNGGPIAICKKKTFLDTQRYNKLNKNILLMYQNAKEIFSIPIDWNYTQRWIVSFDFTENNKLYGICNDGTIYKFDTLLLKAREQITSQIFKQEQIYKAKFIENGFIALTCYGTFYYVKEFNNVCPVSIFQMNSLLEFSNDVDFIAIPPSESKSKKLELFFTNEKGNGVIHVMEQPKGFNYSILPIESENGTDLTINGVSILENNELEPYIKKSDDISTSNNINENKNDNTDSIGNIVAMAISPSYSQLAFYNSEGIIYLYSSKFDRKRKETKFQINDDLSEEEINEQKSLISFDNDYQFLFCGEDAIAISGQRFILLVNTLNITLSYKIIEGEVMRAMQGGKFFKCISEVDGLRLATNEGMFLISKVNDELYKTCFPFSKHPAKKLLKAYISDLMKEPNFDVEFRKLYNDLPDAISVLAKASANIFWTEDEEEEEGGNKKEVQLYILKAAQLGKYFVQKEEFNFNKYKDICRNIRFINEIRNNKTTPILITYREFDSKTEKDIIKKIISFHNFKLAFIVSEYFGFGVKKIYRKWANCKIKKLKEFSTKEEQLVLFETITSELKDIKNISFIKLAKKAFKYNQNEIGMKFLECEKSILAKIPQYLAYKKWDKALELSYETYDSDIIAMALNEIIDYNKVDKEFIEKVKNIKNIKYSVIDYLKKNHPIYIENLLDAQGDYEELMLLMLENFFTTNKLDEKKKYIKLAKEYQKKLDKTHINNKFYSLYLNELDKSLNFKKECMDIETNIIKKSSIQPFDNSIYDCYKLGVKQNNLKFIEAKNKDYELNSKKMGVMQIRSMAENGKIDMVNKMVKESSLKKLNLTPLNLAELYFDYKRYDLAVEYIRQMNNSDYFEYKVDMLIYMEKYEDALDVIISSKYTERIPDYINNILIKKPNLQNMVKDLCKKYKVNLN